MVKPTEQEAAATQINVVLNWFEELKRRVPVCRSQSRARKQAGVSLLVRKRTPAPSRSRL